MGLRGRFLADLELFLVLLLRLGVAFALCFLEDFRVSWRGRTLPASSSCVVAALLSRSGAS